MKFIPILLSAGLFNISLMSSAQTGNNPEISFEKLHHDYGKIQEMDGKAEVKFYFTNTGKSSLFITNVQASCGCTAAEWTTDSVKPNKTGFVKVVYDPKDRPGEFVKTISVFSNATQGLVVLTIKGNVIARTKGPEDFYPTAMGNLRFTTNHMAFGVVKTNTTDTVSIIMYNQGSKPITINNFDQPEHITFHSSKMTINPKDTATLTAIYDARHVGDFGFLFLNCGLQTSDSLVPRKNIYTSASVEEYFPPMTEKQMKKAPKIVFDKTSHNFGKLNSGQVVTTVFEFKNEGKEDLIIRKSKASCGCTATEPDKKLLKPGETAKLTVTFNTSGKHGHESKTISVISNDPVNSTVVLTISADIE